jgi:hypothetical protein
MLSMTDSVIEQDRNAYCLTVCVDPRYLLVASTDVKTGIVDVNDYYSAQRDPKKALAGRDKVLADFFQTCFGAGPQKCATWRKGGPSSVKDAFLKADQMTFEKPLSVSQIGLLFFSEWRALLYGHCTLPGLRLSESLRL